MSGFDFPGGIDEIAVDDTGSFDTGATTDPSTFLVTIDSKHIHKDATEFPDPEALTAELADDREGRLGLNQDVSFAALSMDMADFQTLEDEALNHTDLYIRVKSHATTPQGDPLLKVVYAPVVLSNAVPSPVNVSRDAKGGFLFEGRVTGYRWADLASITRNGTS